jgi:hypothetical protein
MKKTLSIILFALSVSFVSCDHESEGIYTDDTTEPVLLYDYYVDEYGNEGVVVFMSASSRTYYIVLSSDESFQSWGPMGEQIYAVDSVRKSNLSTASYGVAMHQTMKARRINRYPAQAWCDMKNQKEDYSRGGSWRLPTHYEWTLILGAKGAKVNNINTAMLNIGGTPLNEDFKYWCCDEDYEGHIKITDVTSDYDSQNRAVITSPLRTTFSTKERWLKKNKYYVRAIKYIYYED